MAQGARCGSYSQRVWRRVQPAQRIALEPRSQISHIANRGSYCLGSGGKPATSDCEGDEVCHLFVFSPAIKYLSLHPNGAHAAEALKNLNEMLTDEVIKVANSKGGDKYAVEQRTDLKKLLASLRLVVAKTSAPEKAELLKKLERINPTR